MKKHNPPPKADYTETINGISFKMIFIEGGEVVIGRGEQQQTIKVPDFHLAEMLTTQELWRVIMGEDPPELHFKGDQRPVENVSWLDIVEGTTTTKGKAFLDVLNEKSQYGGYKLPSEAMWQFAAQGGCQSAGTTYAGSNNLKEVGWFWGNSHRETKNVGLKLPNELGLYDMSGNVEEWCADVWNNDPTQLPQDGAPNQKGDEKRRVIRGGSWYISDYFGRVSNRLRINSDLRSSLIGFRFAWY